MDFIKKVEETATSKGKVVADKAKQLAEIASLKSQVATCEEVIRKNYAEIGKIYYENYANCPEELFEKQCKAIANAQNGAKELEQKIKDIKGV